MAKIEKNIRIVKWRNEDGTLGLRYRVRISRKDLNHDHHYETLEEANEVVRLAKSAQGRSKIAAEQQQKSELELALREYAKEPSLDWFLGEWANLHYPLLPETASEALRHKTSVSRSRIEVAKRVEIEIPIQEMRDAPALFQGLIKQKFSKSTRFGLFKPTEITPKIAVDFVRARKKAVSAATAKRDVSMLRSFFNTIEDIDQMVAEKITQNPFDSAGIRKELKNCEVRRAVRISEFGDDAEQRLIAALEACRNPDMRRIIGLALTTGMRRGEILALCWWQVKEKYIQLEAKGTKNEKDRRVPLSEEARAILAGMDRGEDDKRLFKYTRDGFKSNWNRLRLRAGLKTDKEALRIHDLRHEFISRMLEVISSPTALAAVAGGVSVEHLKRQHIEPETKRKTSEDGITDEAALRQAVGHTDARMTQHYATQIAITVSENAQKARKQAAGYPVIVEEADGKAAAFCPDFGMSAGADTEAEAIENLRLAISEQIRHAGERPIPSSPLKIAREFSGAVIKTLLID